MFTFVKYCWGYKLEYLMFGKVENYKNKSN